jgi:hypothetical protein
MINTGSSSQGRDPARKHGRVAAFAALATACALVAGCLSTTPTPAPTSSPQASAPASPPATASVTATPVPTPGPSPALPQGDEPVVLDPAQFVAVIDHPFWPMIPGSRWVYRETDLDGTVQQVEVTVTSETRDILGITATVVRDVVTEGGELVEDTTDWYGQDAAGNLWYLGEDTKEYENGKVSSTAGTWMAGVDGAQPGIVLPADPQDDVVYRQEYHRGQAEDAAEILSLDERAEVPFGAFDGVLMTKDYTPLEPTLLEHKFYARGVGPVLVLAVSGGTSREELMSFEPGQR